MVSLLGPKIVDAIMDGRPPATVTLANLMDPLPLDWKEQRTLWLAEHAQK